MLRTVTSSSSDSFVCGRPSLCRLLDEAVFCSGLSPLQLEGEDPNAVEDDEEGARPEEAEEGGRRREEAAGGRDAQAGRSNNGPGGKL